MVQASGAGDSKGAEEARRRAETAIAGWAAAMREQSARASDPRLRAALADVGTEVGTLTADLNAIDETALDRLQQRVDQLCGG
jgi:hypothetical protein